LQRGTQPVAQVIPEFGISKEMLLMFACTEGMKAWKHNKYGSCLVDSLMRVLARENPTAINVLHALTKVNNVMSEIDIELNKGGVKKTMSVIEHRLTHTPYF